MSAHAQLTVSFSDSGSGNEKSSCCAALHCLRGAVQPACLTLVYLWFDYKVKAQQASRNEVSESVQLSGVAAVGGRSQGEAAKHGLHADG